MILKKYLENILTNILKKQHNRKCFKEKELEQKLKNGLKGKEWREKC